MASVGNAGGRPELVQPEFRILLAEGQGAVDFVVFDDVGPVFDDPVSAALLIVEEVSKVFGGVVECELSGLQFGDEVSAVGSRQSAGAVARILSSWWSRCSSSSIVRLVMSIGWCRSLLASQVRVSHNDCAS